MVTLDKTKPHPAEGHRSRLGERFIQGGLNAFLDYEIVELLLTLGTPRKDCKPIAKKVIKKFGGLKEVLDAPVEELTEIKGIGEMNIFGLKLFQAISERYAREEIKKRIAVESSSAVYKYLRERIGREKKERFVVLLLDTKNNLTGIVDISVGTLNENLVHPREVFKEAIRSHAAQIIVAHNHPSGDPEPSDEDLKLTKRLQASGKVLGIELLDHIIISRNKFYSLKEHNLL